MITNKDAANVYTNLIDRFLHYLACSSESGNEAELYHILENELTELGFSVRPCLNGLSRLTTPNLYAYLEGQGEPLLVAAHMDTVSQGGEIRPYVEKGVVRSKGDTILGADDKSGIAAIMEAAFRVVHAGNAHAPVEILFTVGEEAGFCGSVAADYSMIRSKRGYVFDSSAAFGSVVLQSPQIMQYQFSIHGKAAHAAINPQQGINAIVVASEIISAVSWGRVSEESTINVGNFRAEGATNVVCEHAEFEAETRSLLPEGAAQLGNRIRAVAAKTCMKYGAQLGIKTLLSIPGFSLQQDAQILAPLYRAFSQCGITPAPTLSYGGSDANILNANGIEAVDVSTGMRDPHSWQESIRTEELEQIADVIQLMMENGAK